MTHRTLLMISLFALAACSGESREPGAGAQDGSQAESQSGMATGPAPGGEEAAAVPSWRDQRESLGRETYRSACASCHDSGEDGAPVIGRRDDWSGRSDMWQAVLFQHAKAGYMDMPGQAGDPDLSDEAVEAATEYLLEQTFPERPRD